MIVLVFEFNFPNLKRYLPYAVWIFSFSFLNVANSSRVKYFSLRKNEIGLSWKILNELFSLSLSFKLGVDLNFLIVPWIE